MTSLFYFLQNRPTVFRIINLGLYTCQVQEDYPIGFISVPYSKPIIRAIKKGCHLTALFCFS